MAIAEHSATRKNSATGIIQPLVLKPILKNFQLKTMIRFYLLIFLILFNVSGIAQNIKPDYTSNFAKLQSELEKEFGVNKMRTINFCNLTPESQPYALQVIDNSNYELFLENVEIYDAIRILYLDNIDFKNREFPAFEKLKNLKAIRINNCKNSNSEKLLSNLLFAENLEQLHFKNLNFKDWELDVNKLSQLKVLTFENCCLKKYGNISLHLDEFSISKSKKTLDLSNLFITSVKRVNIRECKLETFPNGLSTSNELEHLDLNKTTIKEEIKTDIRGFTNLQYLDVTDCKIKFKNVTFSDINGKIYVIRGVNVIISERSSIIID
jgi:Leucine-rich repeat (LRR) protein